MMKTLQAVISISILLLSASLAQGQTESGLMNAESTEVTQTVKTDVLLDRFEISLVHNLDSDVPGIVESSLFNSVHYKIAYPQFQSKKVENRLYEIAVEGETHNLRYKAYLALAYYRNQSRFEKPEQLANLLDSSQKDDIFFYLQQTVRSEQYTSRY